MTRPRTRLVAGLVGVALVTGTAHGQAPKHEFASDRPTDFAVLPATAVVPAYTLDDLTHADTVLRRDGLPPYMLDLPTPAIDPERR